MSPLAFAGCLLALAMTLGLGATGVFCGVRGLTLSVTERQPIAMGLAGSLLNAVAFLIWAGIGVDLLVWYSHR
jgi:hypothetical protein